MYIFRTGQALGRYLTVQRHQGRSIGFVPTMGALHQGHLSLIALADKSADCIVTSIFVNPTQFNSTSDLEQYPRPIARDIEVLFATKNEVLFLPDEDEIYPTAADRARTFDFKGVDSILEGAFRPGHFRGVGMVMHRLLNLVRPDFLSMGQKDYQQTMIIRHLLKMLDFDCRMLVCPIIREKDGLAMSSRNVRLNPAIRTRAAIIYQTLQDAKSKVLAEPPAALKTQAIKQLAIPDFKAEYFEILDADTFRILEDWSASRIVACTAVWAGDVRLIDNMLLKD